MIPSPAEITYFHEVALIGNVSQAALKLKISQPSLSLAMQRLEKNVGATLFVRHKQGVTLTPAGKKLLQQVKPLLLHWENTKNDSLAAHHDIQGEITLGCHTTVALFIHQFLPQLLKNHPKLSFHFKHDISQNTTMNVINSVIDIGVVINPIKHPDLIIRKINPAETTFWTSTKPSIMQDIHSDQLVIICDTNIPQTHHLLRKWKTANLNTARIITSNSLEVVANLTVHGCGIGIMSSCFLETLYPKQLNRVAGAPAIFDEVYLIYRKENKDVKAVTTVIDAIKKFAENNRTL